MKSLIIVNPADCIGCRTCEVACVVAHPSEQELNADVFLPRLKVQRLDSISAPVMCHQCENAPCVGACPVGALTMGEQVVQANSARCIGCQSCVSACPFGMITIQSLPGDTRQQIVKCDLCEQREEGDPRHKIGIRIELYSYEDIYQLASDRNSVFFKLLRREFDLECDQI